MAYDRNDRERDQRSRDERQREQSGRDSNGGDRGFFERAGDEISSWFGDDEAERRRGNDERSSGGGRSEQGRDPHPDDARRAYRSHDERSHDDRPPRQREEPQRRPYSGRPPERSEAMREPPRRAPDMERDPGRRSPAMDREQGSSYRPLTGDYGRGSSERFERDPSDGPRTGASPGGSATAAHDRHYSEWRQRQIEAIDRDYDEYRREHQSKFENDFSSWRTTRQTKREMIGSIKEHMPVVGSDDLPVGTVDKLRGDRLILTKNDSPDGQHHSLNVAMIERVENNRVILDRKAEDAKAAFGSEERDRALNERDEPGEAGPHILNRSFSGTY